MTRAAALAIVALAVPGLAHASVEVQQHGARVSVHAQSAALPEVLDRLSKATGMKVVYEGARPQTLVNASLDDRTPAEAVLTVLEGLGLNFLARMDVTGSRVEHLVIAGAAGAAATAPASAAPVRPAAAVPDDDEEEDSEEAVEVPKPEPPRPGMMLGARPRPLPATPEAPAPANSGPAAGSPAYPTFSPFAPTVPAPPTVVLPQPPPDPVEEPEDDGSLQ